MAGDSRNPSLVGVTPGLYAGFVAPKRAAVSTILPGGNTVDRGAINKTLDTVSKNGSQAHPLGTPSGSGY